MTLRRAARSPSPIIFAALLASASIISFLVAFSPYIFTFHNPGAITLSASLNSTELSPNQTISVTVSDRNGLQFFANELSLPTDWVLAPNLSMGPRCGGLLPLGVAVFQGSYVLDNVLSGKELDVYDPFAINGCGSFALGNSFTFKPGQNVTASTQFSGYYTGQRADDSVHPFPPGEYTVLAGDAWGHMEVMHFEVTSSSTPGGPVEVVSVTGPIPPYNPGGPVVSITLKNIGDAPITSLNASLPSFPGGPSAPYSFVFNMNSSNPLTPGQSVQETRTLIGASLDSSLEYPLTIRGALLSGTQFSYTVEVQVVPPG